MMLDVTMWTMESGAWLPVAFRLPALRNPGIGNDFPLVTFDR